MSNKVNGITYPDISIGETKFTSLDKGIESNLTDGEVTHDICIELRKGFWVTNKGFVFASETPND